MSADQSLRGFLEMVEEQHPAELVRVSQKVSSRLDITGVVFEAERLGRSPVFVFEKVDDHAMPVVTNVAGNRHLLAAALGVQADELPLAFRERAQNFQPVETVNRAPWQDIVI